MSDPADIQDELRKIREAMRAQEALRGILPDEQVEADPGDAAGSGGGLPGARAGH